jgi:hypothetical protein
MKLKNGFVLREVCGEEVVMAEGLDVVNFNKLISLNETAAFIWKKAVKDGDFTPEQLAEYLCEEYDVDSKTALADVNSLIEKWKDMGLFEE